MKFSLSIVVTVFMALLGALVFSTELPPVLDTIFTTVSQSNHVKPIEGTETDQNSTTFTSPKTNKAVSLKAAETSDIAPPKRYEYGHSPGGAFSLALLGLIVGGAIGSLASRAMEWLRLTWEKMPKGDKVTVFVGCVTGVIFCIPAISIVNGLAGQYAVWIEIPLVVALTATMVYVLQSMEEALPWYALIDKKKKTDTKILDTNVLIDGRIYEVIRCGFMDGDLYTPQFVINELQHIADSSDAQRRQRGRRGLDILKKIQSERTVEVGNLDRFAGEIKDEVDLRLVKLAQSIGASLVTNDYNLNKVATIHDVRVINLNDLVTSLRSNVLPGEKLEILILREGKEYKQGVGYLDDGTMVVVERGADLIGQTVHVEVSQVIQTERGKMIFSEAPGGDEDEGDLSQRRKAHRRLT